jgi:hypothetical protein
MPWCNDCAKFWSPSSVAADGSCPTCGRGLAAPSSQIPGPGAAASASAEKPYKINVRELAGEDAKAPWHFKLLVVAIIAYLVWRIVQLVGWIIG